MNPIKQIYLLLIYQGFYLGSVCQRWTFPSRITALIGSCVEIPCTYHPARRSGASSAVWYLYHSRDYIQILNTKDSSSSIRISYKGRTSLVSADNSCTLRIDPVKREDGDKYYYPGIAEDIAINAADEHEGYVYLSLTGANEIQLFGPNIMTEGEATLIRCTIVHTCRSSPPSLEWNKPGQAQNQVGEISGGSWIEASNLTYIPSYVDDGTTIQCTATYHNGRKAEVSGTLNINYAPKNVAITVVNMGELMEGSDVTLRCKSFSKTDVYEYEWYKGKDKTKLPDRGWEITVRNVTRDGEPYSCAAINQVGRGESALTEIPVLHAPTGVHITVNNEGEFTELTCDFLRSRPDVTHYTWMKDGSILQSETGKTLTVDNNEGSSGQYSCIAHNSVGNSTSAKVFHDGKTMDLPIILGSIAGVFLLLFLILIVYFCLRRNKKPASPSSPIHGTISNIPYNYTTATNDNQYGNIQSNHQANSSYRRSELMVNVKVEENDVIYSNSDVMQPSHESEYSVIYHGHYENSQNASSRVRQSEVVEYAMVKR
ncbi:B-cell receptor CD22-like [Ranitomeya imitator]|uniref:B-cell receptor CD22-like n=1 Tax=Ranitomeya imitator TaxID=111125 RepID=UPI0037E6FAD2